MNQSCCYIKALWQDETGQDLVEYSLLLAFLAMTAMALLSSAGSSIKTVWTGVNSQLKNAAAS
jgi:Flp pilus assembly pilin Flp